MASWAPVYPAVVPIPVDLFVSKKHPGLNGDLGFADSQGIIVFKISTDKSSKSSPKKVLLDASGNPLISMYRDDNGSWKGFKGGNYREKGLIFRVQRTLKRLTRTELEVFLVGEISGETIPDFKVKGFPFQRACTIYGGDSIVAQHPHRIDEIRFPRFAFESYTPVETSLMYKLHQIYARRSKFRLTIFPGSVDHSFIASLMVIFLYGQ